MRYFSRLLVVATLCVTMLSTHAQQLTSVPQGINYQSVARTAGGTVLSNQMVAVRLTIHDVTPTGAIVYSEVHHVQTNAFGTFGVVIGGGIVTSGSFGGIAWGVNGKHLQVEADYNNGSNFTNMGTSQLMSVPFSLYSAGSIGDITDVKYDTTGIIKATTSGGSIISSIKNVWLAGGNANMVTNNWIGTIDNNDFIIKRGSVEAVRYTKGGGMIATGDGIAGTAPATGAGKRMEYVPNKSAFRAGSVSGSQWDDANIGKSSAAFGSDNVASGDNSFASGNNSKAIAANSSAQGDNLISKASGATVVGAYNDTTTMRNADGTPTDVLFQVGNGTAAARSSALTVTKSGQVLMQNLVLQDSAVGTPLLPILAGTVTLNPQNNAFVQVYAGGLLTATNFNLTPGTYRGQTLSMECLVPVNLLGLQFGITLYDHRNTASSTLILNNQNKYEMSNYDIISFIWDGSYWIETSRSQNHH